MQLFLFIVSGIAKFINRVWYYQLNMSPKMMAYLDDVHLGPLSGTIFTYQTWGIGHTKHYRLCRKAFPHFCSYLALNRIQIPQSCSYLVLNRLQTPHSCSYLALNWIQISVSPLLPIMIDSKFPSSESATRRLISPSRANPYFLPLLPPPLAPIHPQPEYIKPQYNLLS